MRLTAVFILLFVTVLGFWACQYSYEEQQTDYYVVQSSIKSLDRAKPTISFLAEEGLDQAYPSGTQIKIPADALIFADGRIVNGEVSLSFEAFQDALDLLIAGFPIDDYKVGMTKTAGAFKMEAFQGDRPVFLDPTKNIFVKLASYEKEDDYSLFFWNRQEHQLDSLLEVAPTINEPHVALERNLRKMEPRIKFPLDDTYFTFNYKGILEVIYNNDFTNVSHPQTQKKMKEYGLRWSDLQVEAFIDFKGKKIFAALMVWKNISRKPLPAWAKGAKGMLQKVKKDRYRLMISDAMGQKKFSTQIEAIIPLEELFSLGPGYWSKDYHSKIEQVKSTKAQLAKMPKTFRYCMVNRFGFYNWQKPYDELESVVLNAHFKSYDQVIPLVSEGVYYLSGDRKGIVYYPRYAWDQLRFFEDMDAQIFTVSNDARIWIFPQDDHQLIELDQLQKLRKPSYLFKMKESAIEPIDKATLINALEIAP